MGIACLIPIGTLLPWSWLTEHPADWAQAFGSVAAIIFGFLYSEHRRSVEERAAEIRSLRAVAQLADDMLRTLMHELSALRNSVTHVPVVDDITLDSWHQLLRAIDASALNSTEMQYVYTVRRTLRTVARRMRVPVRQPIADEGLGQLISTLSSQVLSKIAQSRRLPNG